MSGSRRFEEWDISLSEPAYQYSAGSMGTGFIFKILDYRNEDSAKHFCEMAMEIIEDANQRFSTYIANSELSKINSGAIALDDASSVQQQIWSQAKQWSEDTHGFFTPEAPDGSFDPSGIVKTWAAANAAGFLEANGFKQFTLNAGGDILLSSELRESALTRVGLSNMESIKTDKSFINMVVELNETELRAVATSGSSERGEHIWRKSNEFKQATVIAKDLVTADVWATALIAGGKQAMELLPKDIVAVTVSEDGQLVSTPGFFELLGRL